MMNIALLLFWMLLCVCQFAPVLKILHALPIFVTLDRDTCSAIAVPGVSKVWHHLLQVHLIARNQCMEFDWQRHSVPSHLAATLADWRLCVSLCISANDRVDLFDKGAMGGLRSLFAFVNKLPCYSDQTIQCRLIPRYRPQQLVTYLSSYVQVRMLA